MGSEYHELRLEKASREREVHKWFQMELKKLRSKCPHEISSGWLGDDRYEEVRVCKNCCKELERRRREEYLDW